MIDAVRLRNITAHRDTRVALGGFTVLAGAPCSGKTTVLEALHWMSLLGSNASALNIECSWTTGKMCRGQEAGAGSVEVTGEVDGESFEAEFSLTAIDSAPGWRPHMRWNSNSNRFESNPGVDRIDDGLALRFHRSIPTAALVRLDARAIATAGTSGRYCSPRVGFDGSDVAALVKAISLAADGRWTTLLGMITEVVPQVRSLCLEVAEVPGENASTGDRCRIVFDFGPGARRVPAPQASEGALLAVALLTVLLAPDAPRLVLIDGLERGLHPTAQMELVDCIRRVLALESMRETQVVATTHSPYILDRLDFDEVRVFATGPDGAAAAKSLADHPDAKRARGTLSAGELWSSIQESKWVVEAPR